MTPAPISGAATSPLRLVKLGILSLSPTRLVQSVDTVARQLFGAEATQWIGQPIEACLQPASAEDVAALCGTLPFSYVGVAPATSVRCLVQLSVPPPPLPKNGLLATVVSVNEYLAEAQSLALVQLRNTVQSVIAGFAHEVRNPLAAILSITEAALQMDPNPDSVLVRIPGLVARVESLIKQSLAYSRPKAPNPALHQPSFLVEHAVALLRPRKTNVKLDFAGAKDLPPVMVDLPQGEQVLVNLLENALDAAEAQVHVRVRPGKTTVPSVCIEVINDGPAIPPDVAARIFDPFFTTKAHGTGLGLAIARDLTRLNGGELYHVPTPRGGATFRMFLPSTRARLLGAASL